MRCKQRILRIFILHNGQIVYQVNGGKLFKVKALEGTIIEFRDQADC